MTSGCERFTHQETLEERQEKAIKWLCVIIIFLSILTVFPVPKLWVILREWRLSVISTWIETMIIVGAIIAWNRIRNAGDPALAKENLARLAKIMSVLAVMAVFANFMIDPIYQKAKKAGSAEPAPISSPAKPTPL